MITDLPLPRAIAIALTALPLKKFSDYGEKDDLAPAAIVLESTGRHTLVLGDQFYDKTPEQQAFILKHEFTHLAFGHTLKCMQMKLNPMGWNIATDAWINEVHPHRLTQGLNGILYTELREGMPAKPPTKECPQGIPARPPIPELPPWLIDPISIYNILKEKAEEYWNGMDKMIVQDLKEGTEGRAGVEVLRARRALREAALEDESLQALADELSSSYTGHTGTYTEVKVADWLEQIYRQIDRLASMKQGDLVRRRGWRRPGRYEGLPGTARRPSLNVMIALDVSGSTGSWWGDMIATCRGITRYHSVHIVCFSDKIVFEGSAIPLEAPVGGGTDFSHVVKRANQRRPDCLIWVTDGENNGGTITLPDCPIYCVWLPSSSKWTLRQQDYQVEYQA